MAERLRVGIVFNYNEEWIAGAYYLMNLIKAVNTLPDEEKPIFVIITSKDEHFNTVQENTSYPHLIYCPSNVKPSLFSRLINKARRLLGLKNVNKGGEIDYELDFTYPVTHAQFTSKPLKKVEWVPDLQPFFLPHFFSEELLLRRKARVKRLSEENELIVFSSHDTQAHFNKFFPDSKCNTRVLQFATIHPPYNHIDMDELKRKWHIDSPYFFLPNQFWRHKNHVVVIKALGILIKEFPDIKVLCSGKMVDSRKEGHIEELIQLVEDGGIKNNIEFLGFLDYEEMLKLMSNAIAVIQPSLFEGWSTVVEDCKAMGQFVLASNLPVHQEQLNDNCVFFDPFDEISLAEHMKAVILSPPSRNDSLAYQLNISHFAKQFMEIVHEFKA